MSTILVEYEKMMPTVNIVFNTLQGFSNKYGCTLIMKQTIKINKSDISRCDIILSIRGCSILSRRIAQYAKKNKKKYILAIDDDLIHLPELNIRFPARKKELIKIIKLSDIILTGNKLLGEEYAAMSSGKRFVIVNTPVDIKDIVNFDSNRKDEYKKTRIIYAAGESHNYFFNQYIMPIMPILKNNYKDKISMTFVGVCPDLSQYEKDIDISYVKNMPFQKYIEYMKSNKFDIGLAPLEMSHFCERKYFNKYIEYTTYGICGVYSNCAPYTLIVKNNINGFLCDNDTESWANGLIKAIKDNITRTQCIINAQQQLVDEFNPDKIYDNMIKDIPEFINYKTPRECKRSFFGIAKFEYMFFCFFEIIYLTVKFFKKDGIKKTFLKIKRRFIIS